MRPANAVPQACPACQSQNRVADSEGSERSSQWGTVLNEHRRGFAYRAVMPKVRFQRGAQTPSHWEDGCLSFFALTEPQQLRIEVDAADFQVRHVRCPQSQFTDAEDDCVIASA
jgi:hypothetical protein